MKKEFGNIIYSPSDLIRYLASPFASWLDRYYLENLGEVEPDEQTEEEKLLSRTGDEHEQSVLSGYKASGSGLVEIARDDKQFDAALAATLAAINDKAPIIYQAALQDGSFAGYADFLKLDGAGKYQVWDTKLALSPKPYYPIQLCCYSEMLAAATAEGMPGRIGVILGNGEEIEFRVEDFIHYYRKINDSFIAMQAAFSGNMDDCPEPVGRDGHGRWKSLAENFFIEKDHLVQVAGITAGQRKKLKAASVTTMAGLAAASGKPVHKLDGGTLEKLVAQARLQCDTRDNRKANPDAKPRHEVLVQKGPNGEPVGLAVLPPGNPTDVFFDMEGYPLVAGGLEYLFGTWAPNQETGQFAFKDWWAHDRDEEKVAFENFVDWVFDRWRKNPGMHIYHYANYEVSAVRRLSTRHDTRQEEVDELLRNNVFVDLYKIVRHGLRIGEDSYSLKAIELLYRPKRATGVASASDSMVQYANWMQSGQSRDWRTSNALKGLRDYNEDDCKSTAELTNWLRKVATEQGIAFSAGISESGKPPPKPPAPEIAARQELAAKLRARGDAISLVLADVVDFHRRELKPMWWKMFERADATAEELRDDSACIEGVKAVGACVAEKRSFLQKYEFDPAQECKLDVGDRVMFTHNLDVSFGINEIDLDRGELTLKIGQRGLDDKCYGMFPNSGSVLKNEYVAPGEIPGALSDIGDDQLSNCLVPTIKSFLERSAPHNLVQDAEELPLNAALRITKSMSGDCLVIQGPPGTGKTFTASCVIEGQSLVSTLIKRLKA